LQRHKYNIMLGKLQFQANTVQLF